MDSTTQEKLIQQTLDHDVDYSPWQRKKVPVATIEKERSQHSIIQPSINQSRVCSRNTHIPPEPSNEAIDPYWELRRECSTRCRHLKLLTKPPEVVKKEIKKVKDGVLSMLKVQIKEKRFSLHESKQRYLRLIHENIKLQDEISSFEKETHSDVKSLLENHRKYRDGLTVLTSQHSCAITQYKDDLQCTEKRVHFALKILNDEIKTLDDRIENEKQSLKTLLNYKEKEYPEQLEQIKTLNEEIVFLDQYHNEVMQDLEQIADTEKLSYQSKTDEVFENVKWEFADEAMRKLDPGIKKLALQNNTMKKEISIHQTAEESETKEIKKLKKEIYALKQAEKMRVGMRARPEDYQTKCPSDEEVSIKMP